MKWPLYVAVFAFAVLAADSSSGPVGKKEAEGLERDALACQVRQRGVTDDARKFVWLKLLEINSGNEAHGELREKFAKFDPRALLKETPASTRLWKELEQCKLDIHRSPVPVPVSEKFPTGEDAGGKDMQENIFKLIATEVVFLGKTYTQGQSFLAHMILRALEGDIFEAFLVYDALLTRVAQFLVNDDGKLKLDVGKSVFAYLKSLERTIQDEDLLVSELLALLLSFFLSYSIEHTKLLDYIVASPPTEKPLFELTSAYYLLKEGEFGKEFKDFMEFKKHIRIHKRIDDASVWLGKVREMFSKKYPVSKPPPSGIVLDLDTWMWIAVSIVGSVIVTGILIILSIHFRFGKEERASTTAVSGETTSKAKSESSV